MGHYGQRNWKYHYSTYFCLLNRFIWLWRNCHIFRSENPEFQINLWKSYPWIHQLNFQTGILCQWKMTTLWEHLLNKSEFMWVLWTLVQRFPGPCFSSTGNLKTMFEFLRSKAWVSLNRLQQALLKFTKLLRRLMSSITLPTWVGSSTDPSWFWGR